MTYPTGWDLVNVTGTYVARDGVPCAGSVTFSSPQLVLRSGIIVPAADIVFTLDANGSFTGQIPATDDPNANPSGWVYTVTENVPGGRQGYLISAPHTSPGIDLSTVVPIGMPMPPTFGFPYVTLAQLAGAAPGDGAYLIGYQLSGTGTWARTVQTKLQESVSAKDFGAIADGNSHPLSAFYATLAAAQAVYPFVTSLTQELDWAAIQAGLNYCSTAGNTHRLYLPAGTYIVSNVFTLSHPVRLIGDGNGFQAWEVFPAETGTTVKYTGTAGATMLTLSAVNFGNAGIEGIAFDCNSLAAAALDLNEVVGASFDCFLAKNFTGYGIKLEATTGTCSWNNFTDTVLECPTLTSGTKAALWLSGVSGGGNACHNSFINTKIDMAGSFHGIYLGGCDNNSFWMTYEYRAPGGTGNGVYVDPTEQANFPGNNTFYHLESSTGGWYQPAGVTNVPARIYGYMQDNGQPLPVLDAGNSEHFDCPDTVFPVTVAAGTGWSGGTPTFEAWYKIFGGQVWLTIYISGTAVVAAGGATITGIPVNNGNPHALGMGFGTNVGGTGEALYGYISGSTLTIQSGITSTSSAQMTFIYQL